ncbi:hypothetical protein ACSSS7_007118 [Eimeria intestinalis]
MQRLASCCQKSRWRGHHAQQLLFLRPPSCSNSISSSSSSKSSKGSSNSSRLTKAHAVLTATACSSKTQGPAAWPTSCSTQDRIDWSSRRSSSSSSSSSSRGGDRSNFDPEALLETDDRESTSSSTATTTSKGEAVISGGSGPPKPKSSSSSNNNNNSSSTSSGSGSSSTSISGNGNRSSSGGSKEADMWHLVSEVEKMSQKSIRPMTLMRLVRLQNDSPQARVRTAQWVRNELPIRLAHRLYDFHRLPFCALCCPPLHEVYRLYTLTFERLRGVPPITKEEQFAPFVELLEGERRQHDRSVDLMGQGVQRMRRVCRDIPLDGFLERFFYFRIGRRIMIDNLVALQNPKVHSQAAATAAAAVLLSVS